MAKSIAQTLYQPAIRKEELIARLDIGDMLQASPRDRKKTGFLKSLTRYGFEFTDYRAASTITPSKDTKQIRKRKKQIERLFPAQPAVNNNSDV